MTAEEMGQTSVIGYPCNEVAFEAGEAARSPSRLREGAGGWADAKRPSSVPNVSCGP